MKMDTVKTVRAARAALLLWMTALLVMLSCVGTGTEPTSHDRDEFIVQAYLYAGRPVSDVRVLHLTKTIHDTMIKVEMWNYTINRMDTIDTIITMVKDSMVDNALVTISNNGISYGFVYRDSGLYQETSGSLVIAVGQTYRIDVIADGRHAWAETTVPSGVGSLSVSRDTIYTDTVQPANDTCGKDGCKDVTKEEKKGSSKVRSVESSAAIPDNLARLSLKWNNPDGAYFYYKCTFDPNSPYFGSWTGTYTDKDSLTVTSGNNQERNGGSLISGSDSTGLVLPKPGRYTFILYSTTPDYRSMLTEVADSTHQDRWVRSPNNINGGLGFFTSFGVDSAFFNIVPWSGSN